MPTRQGTKAAPWDQRLAERVARDAWLAANRPSERRRNDIPLRTRVRSRWFWLSLLPLVGVASVFLAANPRGWPAAVLWIAYFAAMALAPVIQRRIRRSP